MLYCAEFLATNPEVSGPIPAPPDFLSSSGSGTGCNQPRDDNWGATFNEEVAAPVYRTEINGRGGGGLRADYPQNLVALSRYSSLTVTTVSPLLL
jgi:hypothetical protein